MIMVSNKLIKIMQSGIPNGNAYLVNTPELDKMGATLYAEQQRKDAEQKRANDLLDAQFAKELGGVRSTDVPDLTSKYAQMKLLKQGTYNKKLKDADRIALQQKAIGATADTYQTINQSKEIKNTLAAIQADQKKNPNDYSPEYTNLMQTALSLPTSKLKAFDTGKKDANGKPIVLDLTSPDTYAYQLGSTDFSKEGKAAMGDIKAKRGNTITIDTPDKMATINVEYQGINSPEQYLQNLQQAVVGSKKTADFIKEMKPLVANEDNIINNFDALTKTEAFKNAYPNFKGFNPMLMNTELGKAMILSAMNAHVVSPPREVKSNPTSKVKDVLDYKSKLHREDMATAQKNSLARIAYMKSLGLSPSGDDYEGVAFDNIGSTGDVDLTTGSPQSGSSTVKGAFGIPTTKVGKISKGVVFDANGDVMQDGEITLDKDKLGADMVVSLDNQKILLPSKVKAKVKQGVIQSIDVPNYGVVDRTAMLKFQNVYNKKIQKDSKVQAVDKQNTPSAKKTKIHW